MKDKPHTQCCRHATKSLSYQWRPVRSTWDVNIFFSSERNTFFTVHSLIALLRTISLLRRRQLLKDKIMKVTWIGANSQNYSRRWSDTIFAVHSILPTLREPFHDSLNVISLPAKIKSPSRSKSPWRHAALHCLARLILLPPCQKSRLSPFPRPSNWLHSFVQLTIEPISGLPKGEARGSVAPDYSCQYRPV